MRIVCENCSTKYSIADEKVRGKVFKIRCKKCGHIIVVRGAPETPAPAAQDGSFDDDKETRVFDYSGFSGATGGEEPIWHVVINKEDVGPLTASQVREKFAAGEIDTDTFVWREGFADWVRLGAVEEFADLEGATVAAVASPFGGGAADPFAATGAAEPAKQASTEPAQREPASDPIAAAPAHPEPQPAAPAAADPFAATAAESAQPAAPPSGGDLFGAPPSGGASRGSLFPDEEEEEPPKPAMTGQRNENSVLFSLANLQALATGGARQKAPSVGLSSTKSSSKEGSGLLDIRAMAATTLASGSASSSPAEDVAVPNPFAGPIAAPVLMPVASERPKWLIPVLVLGGALLVAVVVLGVVIVLMKGKKPAPAPAPQVAQATVPNQQPQAPSARPTQGPSAGTAQPAARPTAPGAETAKPREDTEAQPDEPRARAGRASRTSRRSRSRRSSASRGSSRPPRIAARATTPNFLSRPRARRRADDDPLAALLGKARARPRTQTRPRPAAPRPGKPKLTPSDVRAAMARVKGGVRRCYDKYRVPGIIKARVTVNGSTGRVASVSIGGKFRGTPTGSCVARAIRRARFPKFAKPKQSFTYPFILR